MSNGADCTACHTGYPASHPTADCAKCHDHAYAGARWTHGGAIPTAAGCSGDGGIEQDDTCHDLDHREDGIWGVWGSGPFACADCHSATYPAVAQHTAAETTAAHVSDTSCNGTCHSMNLVTEHGKYPKTATIKYQCTLCHAPEARQQVKDAVAAGNTECGACHEDGTGHEAVHADDRRSRMCGQRLPHRPKPDLDPHQHGYGAHLRLLPRVDRPRRRRGDLSERQELRRVP